MIEGDIVQTRVDIHHILLLQLPHLFLVGLAFSLRDCLLLAFGFFSLGELLEFPGWLSIEL